MAQQSVVCTGWFDSTESHTMLSITRTLIFPLVFDSGYVERVVGIQAGHGCVPHYIFSGCAYRLAACMFTISLLSYRVSGDGVV